MSMNGAADAVRDTIYRSCLYLDDGNWTEFLDCCEAEFSYAIRAFSPEISKDMTYFAGNWKDLETMLGMLPKHNTDHSPLKRHVTVYTVDFEEDGREAKAVTSFVIYQNMYDGINSHMDAGENRLFLVGKYIDRLKLAGGKAKLLEREVRLDTRRLDKGSHFII